MGVLRTLYWLLALTLMAQLSGCLLNRVYAFKEQFCDYQSNFTFVVDDGVSMHMHHPVLRDTDVIWLLGASPTFRTEGTETLEMVYVVEKDIGENAAEYAIPLHLEFQQKNGQMLLRAGIIDKNLSAMITPGLIRETVAHACTAQARMVSRSVHFDLHDLDPDDIPTPQEIVAALGPPNGEATGGMLYRFRLRGAGPEVEKSFARIWLDSTGKKVERVQFRYLIYQLDADFVSGEGLSLIHI